jgi:hypothetical protein
MAVNTAPRRLPSTKSCPPVLAHDSLRIELQVLRREPHPYVVECRRVAVTDLRRAEE